MFHVGPLVRGRCCCWDSCCRLNKPHVHEGKGILSGGAVGDATPVISRNPPHIAFAPSCAVDLAANPILCVRVSCGLPLPLIDVPNSRRQFAVSRGWYQALEYQGPRSGKGSTSTRTPHSYTHLCCIHLSVSLHATIACLDLTAPSAISLPTPPLSFPSPHPSWLTYVHRCCPHSIIRPRTPRSPNPQGHPDHHLRRQLPERAGGLGGGPEDGAGACGCPHHPGLPRGPHHHQGGGRYEERGGAGHACPR